MIELGLVLGVNLIGLVFAIVMARWLVARDAGGADLRRLGLAIERAIQSFIWGQLKRVALSVLFIAAVVFALYGFLPGKGVGRIDAGLWGLLGVVIGGSGAAVTAYVAAHVAHKSSIRCVAATRLSLDRSLTILLRAGGVAGLLAETISAVSLAAFTTLILGLRGGFATQSPDPSIVASVGVLLPTLALGAGTAGLMLQRGGSIYHAAGDIGGELVGERVAQLDAVDSRNPALVADLVGDHVGRVVGRTLTTFVAASASQVVMLIVGISVFGANAASFPGALGLAVLPLVVRAFGVVASSIGLLVVRTTETAVPQRALLRGQVAVWVIALAGIGGATYWLLGSHWWRFAAAGSLGLLVATLVSQLVGWVASNQRANSRDHNDAVRDGAGALISYGFASGVGSALLPLGLLGLGLCAAHWLGSRSAIEDAGALTLIVTAAAMLGPAPFLHAVASFALVADNARGVASLSRSSSSVDSSRRTESLDATGVTAHPSASSYMLLAGACGVLLVAVAAPRLSGLSSPLALEHPAVLWAGFLGVGVVFGYSSTAMQHAARAARLLGKEVERQLKAFPRGNIASGVPRDFTPIYKVCIELAGKASLERLARPVLLSLAVPLVLGIVLQKAYASGSGVALPALVSFFVMATGSGLVLALVADNTRDNLEAVRRSLRTRPASEGRQATAGGSAFGSVLANVGGPAAHLFTLAAAAAVLVAAPFLS